MKNKAVYIVLVALVILTTALYVVFSPKNFSGVYVAMNTQVSVNITGRDAEKTGQSVIDALNAFEAQNSMYRANSEITRINDAAGTSYVKVNDDTYAMINRAYELCNDSGGKFDITVAPLVLAWDVNSDNPKIPKITEDMLSLVNYKDILFDEENKSIMLKNPYQKLDLGGLAKGAACDIVKDILETGGIKEAAISVGGNVIIYGSKEYKVGIKHPRRDGELIANVKLKNKIISTTGDYERYFEIDGKRYHHIFDSETGYPYDSDFYSVTVFGEDGMAGDYLSTLMFMSDTNTVINSLDKYDIIAVGRDGKIYASDRLIESVQVLDSDFSIYSK